MPTIAQTTERTPTALAVWMDRRVALTTRLITTVVAAIGIAGLTGIGTSEVDWGVFVYFTALSNALCLVWIALSAAVTARDGTRLGWRGASTPSARFAAAVTMVIIVTMAIYQVILAPTAFAMTAAGQAFDLTNTLTHLVVPSLIVLDWLLFVPKGRLRWFDPLWWLSIPLLYAAVMLVRGAISEATIGYGARYPYPFLDVDALGWAGVLTQIAAMAVAIATLAYLIVALDRFLARLSARP